MGLSCSLFSLCRNNKRQNSEEVELKMIKAALENEATKKYCSKNNDVQLSELSPFTSSDRVRKLE